MLKICRFVVFIFAVLTGVVSHKNPPPVVDTIDAVQFITFPHFGNWKASHSDLAQPVQQECICTNHPLQQIMLQIDCFIDYVEIFLGFLVFHGGDYLSDQEEMKMWYISLEV